MFFFIWLDPQCREVWEDFSLQISFIRDPGNIGTIPRRANKPYMGSFPIFAFPSLPENPEKSPFPVPVENTPNYRSVCQTAAGNNPSQSTPKAIISTRFSSPSLPHPGPGNPDGMRIWGSVFLGCWNWKNGGKLPPLFFEISPFIRYLHFQQGREDRQLRRSRKIWDWAITWSPPWFIFRHILELSDGVFPWGLIRSIRAPFPFFCMPASAGKPQIFPFFRSCGKYPWISLWLTKCGWKQSLLKHAKGPGIGVVFAT